ncbi:Rv3654c family TadE-like protein [Saccharopolyspora gregorii]|uniref:Rv3654c family TadE-like protein n=1 Tax=Saccharopolyspora gregorii TaxID=33914 RepID=UPI0021ABE7DB|nr:Rv3654c family TadE-like protein [Saccharopolyspora gregorii]
MSGSGVGARPSAPTHPGHRPTDRNDRLGSDEREEITDRGVATVLAAVLVLGVIAIVGFGMVLGSVMLARHRADGAADLAALAAAARVQQGGERACAAARGVAAEMRARVLDCELAGLDARVLVEVRASMGLDGLSPQVTGRARAGPVARSPDGGPR